MAENIAVVGSRPRLRLAELVAALSLGIDLGFDQPMEHVLRQCLISLRIADRLGLDESQRATLYYTALLVGVGCHTDAHEQAKWFGDDIAVKANKFAHDQRSLVGLGSMLRLLGSGRQPLHRVRVGLEFAVSGHQEMDGMIANHSQMAKTLAANLGMSSAIQEAIGAAYERWDGRGWPGRAAGEQIPVAARVAQLAEYVEVAHRVGGVDAATDLARSRAGSQFDPKVARIFAGDATAILDDLGEGDTWESVIAAEPALAVSLAPDDADRALAGVADFVDLKTPFLVGHARAVAALCQDAATGFGMANEDAALVRRAALTHGFGRLGVSNAVWDKPAPLTAGERERVRLHPYLTERMLGQSAWLAPIGSLAALVRERVDGSGYPAGSPDRRSVMPASCSPRPTSTRRCSNPGPTGRPARPRRPAPRSVRRCAGAGSTATQSPPSSPRPDMPPPRGATSRPASPAARWRSSGCSRSGCPTARSPSAWSSHRRPPAITSSTSTRRPARATAPW